MPVTGQKRGCAKSGNRAPLLMRVSVVAHNHVILGIETRKKKAVLDQFLEEQRKEGFLGRVYIFAVQYFSPKETNSFANLANTRIHKCGNKSSRQAKSENQSAAIVAMGKLGSYAENLRSQGTCGQFR
jgi:hypothetical protein